MKIEERNKVEKKFASLIQEGHAILRTSGWDGDQYDRHPNDVDYKRYRTEGLNIVRRVCGESSDYYQELKRLAIDPNSANNSYYLKDCIGIIEAASKDFKDGFLFDLESLVLAELLGDFIDQAQNLYDQNYIIAAASLAGAVLEDTLKKLCIRNNILVPEKTKIDKLNADLAKAVYDVGVQKRITAIAHIRNDADHGNFDKVKKEDVEDMIKWIARFASDYLR